MLFFLLNCSYSSGTWSSYFRPRLQHLACLEVACWVTWSMIAHTTTCIMASHHQILQNISRFFLHSHFWSLSNQSSVSCYTQTTLCCTSEVPSQPSLQNSNQGLWNNFDPVGSCIWHAAFYQNCRQEHLILTGSSALQSLIVRLGLLALPVSTFLGQLSCSIM